jgi:hypothetical protein
MQQETMFLIDEFGTGSDPELGVLWLKFSFNSTIEKLLVITTHLFEFKNLANIAF